MSLEFSDNVSPAREDFRAKKSGKSGAWLPSATSGLPVDDRSLEFLDDAELWKF